MKKTLGFSAATPMGMTLKAFAALLFAFFLFQACRHDAADAATVEIPKSGWALTDRGNCGSGYCEFTIEATTDTVFLYFCGDIVPSSGSCNFGCNTLNNDQSYSALIPPNSPLIICVASAGSVCIRNTPTAPENANLEVKFEGSTTPVSLSLPPGVVRCFHTDDTCTQTNTGCK